MVVEVEGMFPSKEEILSGFQINWITLRDVDTGEILWFSNEDYSSSESIFEVRLPKKILNCSGVLREMHFSSVESWEKLKISQIITYKGFPLEELFFEYGVITRNSNNTWQSVIKATPEAKLMSWNTLSGNVIVETQFYNNETLITTSKSRIFYEQVK